MCVYIHMYTVYIYMYVTNIQWQDIEATAKPAVGNKTACYKSKKSLCNCTPTPGDTFDLLYIR